MTDQLTPGLKASEAPFEASPFNATSRIMTPTPSYAKVYPGLIALANKQFDEQFWTVTEMKVELDRMQLLYELTPVQLHAVKYILQLFLKYELIVGEEFWMGHVAKHFPRPEVVRMASAFAAFELQVHAPFYNEINVQLGLDKDEDYIAFAENPELQARVDWMEQQMSGEDKLMGTITFGLTETALLFSAFAMLKSHQCNGYNKIPVIVRGTNQSAIDEDLHGIGVCEVVNIHYQEIGCRLVDDPVRYPKLVEAALNVMAHEETIIREALPEGHLNGQTAQDYIDYVKVRINTYFERLQCPPLFPGVVSPITDWFETQTYAYKMIDFFSPGMGMEYESSWDELAFVRGFKESNGEY